MGGKVQETAGEHNDWLKVAVKKVFLSLEDVDWSRTIAYANGYAGPIYFNLKGRGSKANRDLQTQSKVVVAGVGRVVATQFADRQYTASWRQ